MFAYSKFSYTPFATSQVTDFIDQAWGDACQQDSTWNDQAAQADGFSKQASQASVWAGESKQADGFVNQSAQESTWDKQDKSRIPSRKCIRS